MELFKTKKEEEFDSLEHKYNLACKILAELIAIDCGHYPIEETKDRREEMFMKAEVFLNGGYVEMR